MSKTGHYIFQYIIVRVIFINILLAGGGMGLIVLGLIMETYGLHNDAVERFAGFASSLLTFLGVLVTAGSIYLKSWIPSRPDPASTVLTAPVAMIACMVAIIILFWQGSIPANVVNGFALLGLAGALLRIQPNRQNWGPAFSAEPSEGHSENHG